MLPNYNPIGCVNPCPLVSIRAGISNQRQVDSNLDKTRPAVLKIRSWPPFKAPDQIEKFRASIQQADRRKLTASVMTAFFLIATVSSQQRAAFTIFVLSRSSSVPH